MIGESFNAYAQLLEQEQSLESLVCAMTERYDVDQEQARQDAEEFLQKLRSVHAIQEK